MRARGTVERTAGRMPKRSFRAPFFVGSVTPFPARGALCALLAVAGAAWAFQRFRSRSTTASPNPPPPFPSSSPPGRIRRQRRRQPGASVPSATFPSYLASVPVRHQRACHSPHRLNPPASLRSRWAPHRRVLSLFPVRPRAHPPQSGGSPARCTALHFSRSSRASTTPFGIHAHSTVTSALIQPAVFGGEVGWRGVRGEAGWGGPLFCPPRGRPPPPPARPLPQTRTSRQGRPAGRFAYNLQGGREDARLRGGWASVVLVVISLFPAPS
jgi:hypothetical protein